MAFAALNDGEPVEQAKKEGRGETGRLELLEPHLDDIESVFRQAKSKFLGPEYASEFAKPDDILDALVALVVAREGGRNPPRLPQATSVNRDEELDRECIIAYSQETDWRALPANV